MATVIKRNRLLVCFAPSLVVVAWGCGSGSVEDTSSTDSSALSTACANGTEASMETGGRCAPIDDLTAEAEPSDPTLPSLDEARSATASSSDPAAGVTCTGGGAQTGTFYNFAALPARSVTDLQTKMIVNPAGINNTSPCFIFTTATNRLQHGVEVVGSYPGGNARPNLGIFDWSCSSGSPCGNKKGPDWVLSRAFDACHTHDEDDGDGHRLPFEYYSNKTEKIGGGNPPQWRNTVLLWNYCTSRWNQIYAHTYRATNNGGGGWGPVIEPHINGPLPIIKEVGFKSSMLFHDGRWSTLGANVTTFRTPAQAGLSPWGLLFRDPNRSFAVTGCGAPDHVCGSGAGQVCCPQHASCQTCLGQ
jgi:hypothetical protein